MVSGKLFEVGAGMEHKSEDPDHSGNTWSRLDTAVVLVRFAMLLIIIISWLLRFLPTQQAQTGLAAFVLGALLWKIFPWEVGPKFGLRNGFFRTTAERGRSALILISTWAGIGAVIIGGLRRGRKAFDRYCGRTPRHRESLRGWFCLGFSRWNRRWRFLLDR
jgi:hypothetical protein